MQYSKTFPPFVKMNPLVTFCNGGYSLKLSCFPLLSTTFSQPFFLCLFNLIFKFFLQLKCTHTNSLLSFWQFWWHSFTKCNHSFCVYFSTKTILSILTFLMIMPSSPSTSYNNAMKSFFALLVSNNCKEIVRLFRNITFISNVMKTMFSKVWRKTYLSSLACCTFRKLFHANLPRHHKTSPPSFLTKDSEP